MALRTKATGLGTIAALAAILTACGATGGGLGASGESQTGGIPTVATKNTTRIVGGDTTGDAAAVALAVWPGGGQHPHSVTLLPGDWKAALAATPLVAPPFRSALLFAPDGDVPDITSSTLDRLAPTGVKTAGGVKRIRINDAGGPGDSQQISAEDPAALADAIDRSRLSGGAPVGNMVVVVGEGDPKWAMPAAGWAARSGDPVLFSQRDALPQPTAAAIRRRGKPLILVLAPESEIGPSVVGQLQRLGAVVRVTDKNPLDASIAFARFRDGDSGWGVTDPGHGLTFISEDRPLDAAASAALSAAGTFGPQLVMPSSDSSGPTPDHYLLDIQPGYRGDPSRAVYNHGWLVGGTDVFSDSLQAKIDRLLEIIPAQEQTNP